MVRFWEKWVRKEFSEKTVRFVDEIADPRNDICRHFPKVKLGCNICEPFDNNIDPENMLVMLYTWQSGDCSKQEPYNGDFHAAMQAIKAKMLVLPGKTDLYFP